MDLKNDLKTDMDFRSDPKHSKTPELKVAINQRLIRKSSTEM